MPVPEKPLPTAQNLKIAESFGLKKPECRYNGVRIDQATDSDQNSKDSYAFEPNYLGLCLRGPIDQSIRSPILVFPICFALLCFGFLRSDSDGIRADRTDSKHGDIQYFFLRCDSRSRYRNPRGESIKHRIVRTRCVGSDKLRFVRNSIGDGDRPG